MRIVVGCTLFFFLILEASAQNTRSTETRRPPNPVYQSKKKGKKGVFSFLKKEKKKSRTDEVAEFRARLKKVYKQKAKEERLAEKPRYKNPTYFGHKRQPKKRPVGKQKFCKVCKIKH